MNLSHFNGVDVILDLLDKRSSQSLDILLISGLPGSGKSTLSTFLHSRYLSQSALIRIDAYGESRDGKWIVDSTKLDEAINHELANSKTIIFLEGTADNISDLVGRVTVTLFLIPDFESWKLVSARRAVTTRYKEFAPGFKEWSKYDTVKFNNLLIKTFAKLDCNHSYLLLNCRPITKLENDSGWA